MNTHKIAAYWNMRGQTYDHSWQSVAKKRLSRLETDLAEKSINKIKKEHKKEKVKVLDIGIAIGRICDAMLKHDIELYGTDVSQTMIDYCKEKYKNNKKVKQLKIHNILEPLISGWDNFDIVTAFRVLSYYSQLEKELNNIYQRMNVGGILIFTYPNKFSSAILPKILYRNNRFGYEIRDKELKKIIKNTGFSEYHIGGFSRLLDIFYDRCNSNISANILFAFENFLSLILGPTLFVRLFYVTCKK